MIVHATREQAARTRRHYESPHGMQAEVETYLGVNKALLGDRLHDAAAGELAPNAYRVCQLAGTTLHPHFHQADQFQVFVAGSGHIGTHALQAVTVHYASAHSPYGPIVAGPQGLDYLTLRRRFDPGAQWMPDAAPRLRALAGRVHCTHTAQAVSAWAPQPLAAGVCTVTSLIEAPVADACLVDLGAGAAWQAATAADGFVYVLSGTVVVAGQALPAESCLFASRDELPVQALAAGGPARLLSARFLSDEGQPTHA